MPDYFNNLSNDEMSQILLDYARNRLPADKHAEVKKIAKTNPAWAEEIAFYQGLTSAVQEKQHTADPDELGWARLSMAIDDDLTQADLPAANISSQAANDNFSIWKIATCALALLAIVQGALLTRNVTTPIQDDDIYVTVTDQSHKYDSKIIFLPDAREDNIRKLLRSVEGDIISGPSALGVYVVRFSSEKHKTQGLQVLEKATNIVESAQAY